MGTPKPIAERHPPSVRFAVRCLWAGIGLLVVMFFVIQSDVPRMELPRLLFTFAAGVMFQAFLIGKFSSRKRWAYVVLVLSSAIGSVRFVLQGGALLAAAGGAIAAILVLFFLSTAAALCALLSTPTRRWIWRAKPFGDAGE